jgi:putative tryptophan/tyrosine transport system substrate-binding protein
MHARLLSSRYILIALVAAVAALGSARSIAANPGQTVMRLGFVGPPSPSTAPPAIAAFWERLSELGWVEGENLVIERRWADGQFDRLPALFAEVLALKVDILVTYTTYGAMAARKVTSTVPIVAVAMGQPVESGLAQSLSRPGGNLTGLSLGWGEGIGGKWLELLQESVPSLSTVALITTDAQAPVAKAVIKELGDVAATRRLRLQIIEARMPEAFDRAFDQARRQAQALVVFTDPIMMAHRHRITALAAKYRLPAIYALREYTEAGGLMAYGPDLVDMFRRAANYVDKIFKGAKTSDLPIEQPMQYVFVVNLKTAKALGITIRESILLRADEVIR